jgi:hypothetical protein
MTDRLLGLICVVVLLAVVLFGSEAHAQPIDWSSYQLGRSQSSYYQGTAPNGEHWTGQSHTSGHTTYFDAYGPNGQATHCSSYKLGLSAYTDCPVPFPASAMAPSVGANSAKHGRISSVHRVAAAVPANRHSTRDLRRRHEARGELVADRSSGGAAGKVRGIAVAGAPHLSHGLPNSSAAPISRQSGGLDQ